MPRPVRSPRSVRFLLCAALPAAAVGRVLSVAVAALRGRVPMIAALSLPPHNRGSLAGVRPPPPLLRRVRRREWFSCCSWLLLAASRCARVVACPGRLGSAPSLFAFLACVLRASVCLPACWFGSFRFGLPVPRGFSRWSPLAGRGLSALRAPFARSLPRCRSLGRSGWLPSLCSARSSRPLALLPRHSGLPLRGCFVPLRGVGWFFSLPSPSRVLASLRLRPSVRAGNPRSLAPLLVCVPSPPI